MKVITKDADLAFYKEIFKEMLDKKQEVVLWQLIEGKRTICETILVSSQAEAQALSFLPPDEEFVSVIPVYFYIADQQLIFKTDLETLTKKNLTVKFPTEMTLLDEGFELANTDRKLQTYWSSRTNGATERISDFVKVKSMSQRSTRDQDFLKKEFDYAALDEEDKIFADKRESPRVRPKAGKLVKIIRKGESKLHVMKLFDLSTGGMGFLTFRPDDFPKTSEIFVTGFDAFDLDDPLIGVVVAHRAVDEANLEFKIGVKFNEGQE